MSFQLKVSNALDSLAADMGSLLKDAKGNIFMPHYIVTQTEGMNIWLKQQLAHQLGIAANIDFKKPNELILKIYQLLGGVFIETLSRESLVWFLYQLMGQRDFIARYPVQAAYFNVNGPEKDLKRMGLAEKIADLFDQYQIYRPELIKEWNKQDEKTPNLDWQAFLWVKARRLSSLELPDKTFISDYILEQLKHPERCERLRSRLPAVYLFGLSIITRYHMDILSEVARVTEVYFYLLNPAPEIYWQDDKNARDVAIWRQRGAADTATQILGNNLLTSWGKVLQNTFRLLFRNEDLINNYETIGVQEPVSQTLLGKIQYDIFNNLTDERSVITPEDIHDESLTIQSNYTVVREVESLYHYLVHLVDVRREQLSPRDIVVMVSDIDAYAPYIKAVFDNAAYTFRYKIADVSLTQGDNIYSALQQVLQMNEINFTAEAVMQLLDSAFIRKRFRITDADRLRALVQAANIRFGTTGRPEDETFLVSWQYGLKRMMLGLCMSGGNAYDEGSDLLYPLDLAEGGEAWEIIRFCHFVEVLISSIESRKRPRPIGEWVRYVEQVMMDLVFLPEDEPNEDFSKLTDRLRRYNELAELMDESVDYEIFAHNIVAALESESRTALFVNDGITFCSLIPMRSIPFKVVAMLGMDHDKFPRKEKAVNFNLITRKHELGDRNIKDNDKHLFLETVLSAKSYLYISYLGKSISDNTDKPASILVEELISYIRSGLPEDTDIAPVMITHQPLHSFSSRYNKDNPKLYRYADAGTGVISNIFNPDKTPAVPDFSEIRFNDIVSFFKNSIKTFYNKTLGIYYGQDEILLQATELFELGSLEQWSLKNALLQVQEEADLPQLRHQFVRKGSLPLKNIGAAISGKLYDEVNPTIRLLRRETKALPEERKSFTLSLGDHLITGNISSLYDGKIVQLCWSSNTIRYMIEAYLYTLAGIATGLVHDLVLINGKNESNIYPGNIYNITPTEARNRLQAIVDFYKKGLQQKVIFADHFYKDLKAIHNIEDMGLRLMLEKKISNTLYPFDDPYILKESALGLFDQVGIAAGLTAAASLVITPLKQVFPTYEF